MLSNIGMPTLILILVVALLLFGPSKLPELGRAFGKTLREFKNGAKEMMSEEEEAGQPKEASRKNSDGEVLRSEDRKKDDSHLPD